MANAKSGGWIENREEGDVLFLYQSSAGGHPKVSEALTHELTPHEGEPPTKVRKQKARASQPEGVIRHYNKRKEMKTFTTDLTGIPSPLVRPPLEYASLEGCTEIYFDLETTGLPRDSHILQIVAVCEQRRFSRYIIPKIPIGFEASQVNGMEMRDGVLFHRGTPVQAVPLKAGIQEFSDFLKTTTNNILIGHNVRSFDCPLLFNALDSIGKIENFNRHVLGYIDTLKLIESALPGQPSYRLVNLAENLLHTDCSDHEALIDVAVLRQIVSLVDPSFECKLRASFSTGFMTEWHSYSKLFRKNFESLSPLRGNWYGRGIVTDYIAKKIADSGLMFKHLQMVFERNGRQGIHDLFVYGPDGTARVTKRQSIVDDVAECLELGLEDSETDSVTTIEVNHEKETNERPRTAAVTAGLDAETTEKPIKSLMTTCAGCDFRKDGDHVCTVVMDLV